MFKEKKNIGLGVAIIVSLVIIFIGIIGVQINNDKITSISKLRYYLYQYSIDDEVEITYNRQGKEKTVKVKLTENNG